MAKAMLTPNDSDAAGMEIAALRQRIAGLESRTVKLPLPSCTYADHSYPAYSKRRVISLLESLGITVVEGMYDQINHNQRADGRMGCTI